MTQRTPFWLGIVVVSFFMCSMLLLHGPSAVSAIDRRNDAVWINRGGGKIADGSDGIRVRVNAPEQVVYANLPQLCCQSDAGDWGWGVAIGDTSMSFGFGLSTSTWTSVDVMSWNGSVSFESDNNLTDTGDAYVLLRYSKEITPPGGDPITYWFYREITYTYPNNYYTEKYTALVPDGNTADVRIYKGGATTPGQSSQSNAWRADTPYVQVAEVGTTSNYVVGIREVPGTQMSAAYVGNPDDVAPYWNGGAFVDTTATTPHNGGISVYWGVGVDQGVFQFVTEQFVTEKTTTLDAQFSQLMVNSPDDEPALLLTTNNYTTSAATGVGFTVALPSDTTFGADVTSSCNSATINTLANSVVVSNMTIPAMSQCELTIPLIVDTITGITFDKTMVSAVTNVQNTIGSRSMIVQFGTPTPTSTDIPSTPTLTNTATATATATDTNTATATLDTVSTKTMTPTASQTYTPSMTYTPTTTFTPSRIPSLTYTPSSTRIRSATPFRSATSTLTNSPTSTNTATPLQSLTPSRTASTTRTSTPPASLYALRKVAVGNLFALGVLYNNTLVSWGINRAEFQESSIPSAYRYTTFKDVATGAGTSYALTYDGRVYAWGQNDLGQTDIPINARTGISAIGAGGDFAVAVRNDGTVVAWGFNRFGQTNVPSGLNDVVAIDAGDAHAVALKRNGTVVAWGGNWRGQATVPVGLRDVAAVSAGADHTLVLLTNGQVTGWGSNLQGQLTIPATATNIVSIAAGRECSLAVRADGLLVVWGNSDYANFGATPITNAVTVGADNQNAVVGLRDGDIRIAGSNLSGVYTTRTHTRTPVITFTPSRTPTISRTITLTFSQTLTPSQTPTYTPTATKTATKTRTSSRTLTSTSSRTLTPTRTRTSTRTATPTR